jgi:hypothetical protein
MYSDFLSESDRAIENYNRKYKGFNFIFLLLL